MKIDALSSMVRWTATSHGPNGVGMWRCALPQHIPLRCHVSMVLIAVRDEDKDAEVDAC